MEDELDLTLNSFPISYVSGLKILDISTLTEISDVEMENQNDKREKSVDQHSPELNNDVCRTDESDIPSTKDKDEAHCLAENRVNLPPEVSHTLKANANFLIDKKFLNDLLEPENANEVNNLLGTQRNYASLVPSYANDSSKYLSLPEKPIQNNVDNILKYKPLKTSTEAVNSAGDLPYLSISSTPKKLIFTQPDPPPEEMKNQRRVNFAQGIVSKGCHIQKEGIEGLTVPTRDSTRYGIHSFTTYGPEIVFDKLSEIRNHLDVREMNEDADVSDLPLSRLLVSKLNSQKQRTKDLEEELTLNEASLAKVTCELEVVQKRLIRREEQLKEAGDQIGKLQNEWQTIQQRLTSSRDTYRHQNEQLRKIIENLRVEKESAEKELNQLRDQSKQFTELKVQAEGMKHQVEKSCERSQEIMTENERINAALKQVQEKLHHYETEYIPLILEEKKNLRNENEALHSKLDNLSISRNDIEDELKTLKKRHSALLQKATEEAELKDKITVEKEATLEAVEKLKSEKTAMIEDLHYQYQNQLQSILLKKMSEIGSHFAAKEKKIEEEFKAEYNKLKLTYEMDRKSLIGRNAEEQQNIKAKCEKELRKKGEELEEVKKENLILRSQMEAIASAISSVIPHAKTGLFLQKDNAILGRQSPMNLKSRQPSPKDYNLTRLEDLKSCQMSQTDVPKTDEDGSESVPRRAGSAESGSQKLLVPPLITSTSLSTISDGSDDSSEGKITAREKKIMNYKGKGKSKTPNPVKLKSHHSRVRAFNGRKVVTAAQLLGSAESIISSDKSSHTFLREIDREMSDLVQEINSMSEIVAPHQPEDAPKLDSSVERDSSHSTLQRIDKVSDLLSKYITTTKT